MKILLINHYAGSPTHGMEFRPFYLAREWVRAGHQVQIVAASHSHVRAHQPEIGTSAVEDIDGIRYLWYPTPSYEGNGIGRIRNMLVFLWTLWHDSTRLVKAFQPDVVIASSTYPMDIWPARRIASLANAKLVYEVHDLWPLTPMELGRLSKWHPFIMVAQSAEDFAYKHSDKVVSMLPKALEYMVSRGMSPAKFVYVPNGVDEEEWVGADPLPERVLTELSRLRANRLPIVAYTGTHGLANALDVLLDAARELDGKAQVLLVGTGPERERLLARVEAESLTNVTMLPSVPKRTIPTLLSSIDLAYIGWRSNPLYRFGICPNKLMDYMMAVKPIVHSVSAGNDPVAEAKCGVTVPPEDPQAVARAMLELLNLPTEQQKQLGQAGRAFVLKNHTYPVLAAKFLTAIA